MEDLSKYKRIDTIQADEKLSEYVETVVNFAGVSREIGSERDIYMSLNKNERKFVILIPDLTESEYISAVKSIVLGYYLMGNKIHVKDEE